MYIEDYISFSVAQTPFGFLHGYGQCIRTLIQSLTEIIKKKVIIIISLIDYISKTF